MKIRILKIVLIILLVGCLLDMPYGYFQLVRFIGMSAFAILYFKENNNTLKIFWLLSAILINPIFKIALGRFIWNLIDIIWAIVLLISIISQEKIMTRENKNGL